MHLKLYITFISTILLSACNSGQKEGSITFYYYPAFNVYYDKQKSIFQYTTDGGQNWQTKPGSPELAEKLGDKIAIQNTSPQIWQHNAEHRQKHSGVLSDFSQKTSEQENENFYPIENRKDGEKEWKEEKDKDKGKEREKKQKDEARKEKDVLKKLEERLKKRA